MNNYCTKCGKKLEKNDLVCKDCNTPIVDLPRDYIYETPKEKENLRATLAILIKIILGVIIFYFAKIGIEEINIYRIQKKYIEPYLKENYGNSYYSINYDSSGKCIISGNCDFDPTMGCDGSPCRKYEYLAARSCKSYYYLVKSNTREFILTAVNKKNKIYVVEGKNIYGKDKANDYNTISNDIEDDISSAKDYNSNYEESSSDNSSLDLNE